MLNGSLINGIDSRQLNLSLLANKISRISDKAYVVLMHDGCNIYKPHSKDLEHLDWVRGLEGRWVRGHSTLDTVSIDMQSQRVDMLYCSPYSSGLPEYVSQKEHKPYYTGQLKDAARQDQIETMLEKGLTMNYKQVLFSQLKAVSEAIKVQSPDMMVIHVLNRQTVSKSL